MFVVLQRFKIRLGTMEAAGQMAAEDLVPRIQQIPGFVSFHVVDAGGRTVASVGLFETQKGADDATELCQRWFRSDWPSFLAIPPELTRGAALAGAVTNRLPVDSAAPLTFPQINRRRGADRRWNDRRGRAEPVLVSATGA